MKTAARHTSWFANGRRCAGAVLFSLACVLATGCASLSGASASSVALLRSVMPNLPGAVRGPGLADEVSTFLDVAAIEEMERTAQGSTVADLYDRAATGDAEAQRRLGVALALGDIVPRNLTAAVDWLTRAAEQNDCAAQHQLGLLYLGAHGQPHDLDEAAFWLRRAADHQDECAS